MLNQHIENVRKQEAEDFTLSMDKYSFKPAKKLNRPYELRKSIASLVRKPLPQILGLTKGLTEMELNGLLTDALAFRENPGARAWNILKEIKNKKYARNKIQSVGN